MAKTLSYGYVFKRTEKKYLLSADKYKELKKILDEYMQEDSYGVSLISNIYYDTENFDLIRRSIEKPVYKEKLRLRSYGVPTASDTVFLEIKKKYKGTVYKRRAALSLKEAEDYLSDHIKPEKFGQIMKEIDYFISFYKPEAKVYLSYERLAMFGKEDKDLRITFDRNILSRDYDLDLSKGPYGERVIPENTYLMEIKKSGSMPLWLVKTLEEFAIYPRSFSKYGTVYRIKKENNL